MINFLVQGKQLDADHFLAQMEKHTPKRTFFGMFFAQGMIFFLPANMALDFPQLQYGGPKNKKIGWEMGGKMWRERTA
jgi:hypothetical protein